MVGFLSDQINQRIKSSGYNEIQNSKQRGFNISNNASVLSHKFMGQLDQILINLPKLLEWRSFYNNDLPLLVDICKEARAVSIQHNLNKSQTGALSKLKAASNVGAAQFCR